MSPVTISAVEPKREDEPEDELLAGVEAVRRVLVAREVADDIDEPAEVFGADPVVADEPDEQPRDADDEQRPGEVVDGLRERGEPREQRVADERQQHRLAERQDESR